MNSDQVKSVFDQCKIKAVQVEISNFKIGLTSSLLLGSNLEKNIYLNLYVWRYRSLLVIHKNGTSSYPS